MHTKISDGVNFEKEPSEYNDDGNEKELRIKPGIYGTEHGNTCRYSPSKYGRDMAFDIDAGELILSIQVDFDDYIMSLKEGKDL